MSMQFTYYMLRAEIPAHDNRVLAACDGVIACLLDGEIKCVADRLITINGSMVWNIGFTRRKWLEAIVTKQYETPRGTESGIVEECSPLIDGHVNLDQVGIIRRRRLYSLTDVDFRGEDVKFDVDEYVQFARRFMRLWKKGLEFVRSPALPEGYYSVGALDAIRRGVAVPAKT